MPFFCEPYLFFLHVTFSCVFSIIFHNSRKCICICVCDFFFFNFFLLFVWIYAQLLFKHFFTLNKLFKCNICFAIKFLVNIFIEKNNNKKRCRPTTSWKKFINARNVCKEKEGNYYIPQNTKNCWKHRLQEFCEITFCLCHSLSTYACESLLYVCVSVYDVRGIVEMSKIYWIVFRVDIKCHSRWWSVANFRFGVDYLQCNDLEM